MAEQISTRLAQMQLNEEGVIEVRSREGLDLDVEGLAEVQARRNDLTAERCGMLAFSNRAHLAIRG